MSTNISTLGVTYGVPLSGPSLAAIINGHSGQIAITGNVIFNTDDCVLDNVSIDLLGSSGGNITSIANKLIIKQFSVIDGLVDMPNILFPTDSTAGGSIQNCFLRFVYFVTETWDIPSPIMPVNLPDLIFSHCTGNPVFYGAISGATFSYVSNDYTAGGSNSVPRMILAGSNNIIEHCTLNSGPNARATHVAKFNPLFGVLCSKGNIFRYNTFSEAQEEITGWDCLGTTSHRLAGSISAINGNVLTLSSIHGPVDIGFNAGMGDPLTGENSLGMYLLLCNGAGQGKYFEITGQDDADVTLDTTTFSLAGVQTGDIVTINIAFVENEFHHNTITLSTDYPYSGIGYGQHVAFSFWGSCYGNNIHDNIVTSTGTPTYNTQSCAFNDGGVVIYNGGNYTYALNTKNVYVNNESNNVYEDIRFSTFYFNDTYYIEETGFTEGLGKITDTDLVIMCMDTQCTGHVATPHNYVSIHNVLNAFWYNNNTSVPSTIYDERYQSALSGQPALGGETSTTISYGIFDLTNMLISSFLTSITLSQSGGILEIPSIVSTTNNENIVMILGITSIPKFTDGRLASHIVGTIKRNKGGIWVS